MKRKTEGVAVDRLSKRTLNELLGRADAPCVSIFISTLPLALQEKRDAIKLDNLLKEAEKRLVAMHLRDAEARAFLQPAHALLDPMNDMFWQRQSRGLALFRSRESFQYFRLPYSFADTVTVSDRFTLKPVLSLFSPAGQFYVLALGFTDVGLYHGSLEGMSRVDPAVLPSTLAEPLRRNGVGEAFGGNVPVSPGSLGREPAILSRERLPSDEAQQAILAYFQQIRSGIDEFMAGERIPLILAGTDYLPALYRRVNTYPHLLDRDVVGESTGLPEDELYRRVVTIITPYVEAAQRRAQDNYRTRLTEGRASRDAASIVRAAFDGKIDTLFADSRAEYRGCFDDRTGDVAIEPQAGAGITDLVDFAVAHTVLHGGTAFIVTPEQMPDAGPLAAIFRY